MAGSPLLGARVSGASERETGTVRKLGNMGSDGDEDPPEDGSSSGDGGHEEDGSLSDVRRNVRHLAQREEASGAEDTGAEATGSEAAGAGGAGGGTGMLGSFMSNMSMEVESFVTRATV